MAAVNCTVLNFCITASGTANFITNCAPSHWSARGQARATANFLAVQRQAFCSADRRSLFAKSARYGRIARGNAACGRKLCGRNSRCGSYSRNLPTGKGCSAKVNESDRTVLFSI